ncbi:MAG: hypothetical protein IJ150_04390 [Bacteroidales bacterium]|nr:hypothetical protein [Bacteroidales bacterium]
MKKLNFELIRKIDYILVFVAAVTAIISFIVFLIILIIDNFNRNRYEIDEMPVVESPETEIKQYIDFVEKIDDVFIFSVKSSGIRADEIIGSGDNMKQSSSFSNSAGRYYSGDGIVNLLFVKDENNEKKLFDSNVFIYKYILKNTDEYRTTCCNVYAVVTKDTNNDKTLSSRDNISLFISEYDGSQLTEISKSITSFRIVDKNQFLYTEYDGKKLSYYSFDAVKKEKKLIKTVEQEIDEKWIFM